MSNASNLSTLANVLDDANAGEFLKSTGSGGVAFDTVAAGAVVYATADLLPLSGFAAGDMAYVTATNRFYINNGSGWYSISLVNTNPNITSVADAGSNTTPFTLATDQTATVITITAADPEEVPLTYSYSVTSGSLNGCTITGADGTSARVAGTAYTDNVFTVTPHASQDATFTITFTASDGINQATSANAFSLTFVTTVTDSNHTTFLATATGTSDNNNITDSSSNSHSITVTGDAYAGSFSPYRSGGYATSFSRSASSKLEIASMPAIGSGDCSIEAWINIESSSVEQGIILRGVYNSVGGLALTTRAADGELTLLWSGSVYVTSGANIVADKWHWIQVIKSSGTVTIYVNGSSVGSWSNSANVSSTSNYIIGRADSYFDGQIRDLRISTNAQSSSSGSEKLETDSNTTFLSCHLPYLSYATSSVASNSYSSISGTIKTVSNSPYDYSEYDAADHGGSVYFVGGANYSSQYLSLSGPTMPSGDFTLSTWAYLTSNGSDTTLIDFNGNSGGFRILYTSNSNGGYHFRFYTAGGTVYIYDQNIDHHLNQWNYIVVVRDSGTFKLYVNNILIGTSTATPTFSSSTNVRIGQALAGFGTVEGYLSDIRYNPTTAITDFTPPTAPLSSSGTSLHIKGTDASIVDKSQVNNIVMNGPTTGSTTKSAFGSEPTISFASGSNSNRYLEFDPIVLEFMEILGDPSIPFTIEGIWGWQGSTAAPIFEIYQDNNNFFYFGAGRNGTTNGVTTSVNCHGIFKIGGTEKFNLGGNTGSYNVVGSSFKHQAITRNSSGLIQHWYNGSASSNTATHSGSSTVSWASPTGYIGGSQIMGSTYGRFEGYIHQVRLTVGKARYTTNFTAPASSFEG